MVDVKTWMYLMLTCLVLQIVKGQENSINYSVLEEQNTHTLIGNIIPDANLDVHYDAHILRQLRFQILTVSSLCPDCFLIGQSTGLLTTSKTIDRDAICGNKIKCTVALDIAVEPREYFRIIKVKINIVDINDNQPTFPDARISLSISETTTAGATFALPTADDLDSGSFGIQGYALRPASETFEIEVTEGPDGPTDVHLVVKNALDREELGYHILTVVAWDGGIPRKSGSLTVEVMVIDVNDNNPKFDNSTYEVFMFENTPIQTVITTVHAVDPDEGPNGQVVYSFTSSTEQQLGSMFSINANTGEIFIKGVVDYEEGDIYYLGIVAHDRGPNALAAYAKVVVHIWDVNDHPPQITINALTDSGHAQVSENTRLGTFVAHVSVSDPDGGRNGQFTCSLESKHFQLEQLYPTEFKVITSAYFDRETQDSYHLNIVCQDAGKIPQTSTKHVTIIIVDKNDHEPRFDQDIYVAHIRENNKLGMVIAQVNATDDDLGENAEISYSVRNNNGQESLLSIDENSGIISANSVFDYEQQRSYSFVIVATDKGTPPLSGTATLSLIITDMNDEPPRFSQNSYTFGTFENQPVGTEIGTVSAYDLDSPPYNKITFSLDYQHLDSLAFQVDPKMGKITTREMLDREAKGVYRMAIIARNEGYSISTTVNLTVYIADENDMPPVVTFPGEQNYTVDISPFARIGDTVAQIKATDGDVGTNAALNYQIVTGNQYELFDVNPDVGIVLVKDSLRDVAGTTFRLTIHVQDKGSPPLSAVTRLNIFVNSSAAVAYYEPSGLTKEVAIIIVFTILAVLLIIIVPLAVILVKRRRAYQRRLRNYNCRVEASKALMELNVGKNKNAAKKSNVKLDNGDSLKKTKKEVTFNVDANDNGGYKDHSWPSAITPAIIENPRGHNSGISSVTAGKTSSAPSANKALKPVSSSQRRDTPSPCKSDQDKAMTFREETRHRLLYNSPPQKPSPYILTAAQLHVHDMLLVNPPDADSSDLGSLTDSGRGPSEEGDNPSPNSADSQYSPLSDEAAFDKQLGPTQKLPPHLHGNTCSHHTEIPSCSNRLRYPSPTNCVSPSNIQSSDIPNSYSQFYPNPLRTSKGGHTCQPVDRYQLPPRLMKGCVDDVAGGYAHCDDSRVDADSVDDVSDDGTTTSGSYVVDQTDFDDEGPEISSVDIFV